MDVFVAGAAPAGVFEGGENGEEGQEERLEEEGRGKRGEFFSCSCCCVGSLAVVPCVCPRSRSLAVFSVPPRQRWLEFLAKRKMCPVSEGSCVRDGLRPERRGVRESSGGGAEPAVLWL